MQLGIARKHGLNPLNLLPAQTQGRELGIVEAGRVSPQHIGDRSVAILNLLVDVEEEGVEALAIAQQAVDTNSLLYDRIQFSLKRRPIGQASLLLSDLGLFLSHLSLEDVFFLLNGLHHKVVESKGSNQAQDS